MNLQQNLQKRASSWKPKEADLAGWTIPVAIIMTVILVFFIFWSAITGGGEQAFDNTGRSSQNAQPVRNGGESATGDTIPASDTSNRPVTTIVAVADDTEIVLSVDGTEHVVPITAIEVASTAAVALFTDDWSQVAYTGPGVLPPAPQTRWPAATVRTYSISEISENVELVENAWSFIIIVDPDGGGFEPARSVGVTVVKQNDVWLYNG